MNLNKKYILVGLVLLAAAWIGNIFYYQRHMLKEPIFLNHYYDVGGGMQEFRLFYIDNINSKDGIVYVTFPEIGDMPLGFTSGDYNNGSRYYKIKFVSVKMYNDFAKEIPKDLRSKVITRAKIRLNSGKEMDVSLGKIYLYSDVSVKRHLDFSSSGGGSDNSGFAELSSLRTLKVYGISSRFPELLGGLIDVSINKEPLKDVKFPLKLNLGDKLTVDYKFNFKEKDIGKNNVYNFSINVLTENLNGEKGTDPVYVDYWPQSPDEYGVDELIKERGIR